MKSIAPDTEVPMTEKQRKRLRNLWDGLLSVARLPPGAAWADDWEGDAPPERVVFWPDLRVTGCPVIVRASAVQNALGGLRERIVSIEGGDDRGLAAWQARALAAQLLAAADTVEEWAAE